jgi:hypothetical protein
MFVKQILLYGKLKQRSGKYLSEISKGAARLGKTEASNSPRAVLFHQEGIEI